MATINLLLMSVIGAWAVTLHDLKHQEAVPVPDGIREEPDPVPESLAEKDMMGGMASMKGLVWFEILEKIHTKVETQKLQYYAEEAIGDATSGEVQLALAYYSVLQLQVDGLPADLLAQLAHAVKDPLSASSLNDEQKQKLAAQKIAETGIIAAIETAREKARTEPQAAAAAYQSRKLKNDAPGTGSDPALMDKRKNLHDDTFSRISRDLGNLDSSHRYLETGFVLLALVAADAPPELRAASSVQRDEQQQQNKDKKKDTLGSKDGKNKKDTQGSKEEDSEATAKVSESDISS